MAILYARKGVVTSYMMARGVTILNTSQRVVTCGG